MFKFNATEASAVSVEGVVAMEEVVATAVLHLEPLAAVVTAAEPAVVPRRLATFLRSIR